MRRTGSMLKIHLFPNTPGDRGEARIVQEDLARWSGSSWLTTEVVDDRERPFFRADSPVSSKADALRYVAEHLGPMTGLLVVNPMEGYRASDASSVAEGDPLYGVPPSPGSLALIKASVELGASVGVYRRSRSPLVERLVFDGLIVELNGRYQDVPSIVIGNQRLVSGTDE